MPWYGLRQGSGYTVVEAADATDFAITYNADPEGQGVPGQTTSGFANQLLAQNAVNQAGAGATAAQPADLTIPKPLRKGLDAGADAASPGLGLLDSLRGFFGGVTDATGAIEGLAGVVAAFVSALLDPTTWRSLFWIWAGINLLAAGLILWSLGSIVGILKKVV